MFRSRSAVRHCRKFAAGPSSPYERNQQGNKAIETQKDAYESNNQRRPESNAPIPLGRH